MAFGNNENLAVDKTAKASKVVTVMAGLIAGLCLIQLLNLSWLAAELMLIAAILLIISFEGYRIWLVLLFATTLSGFMYVLNGRHIRPDQMIVIVMMIGWVSSFATGKVKLQKLPLFLPIFLFLADNFLSTLFAPGHKGSYQDSLLLGLYITMYFLTVNALQNHPDKLKASVKAFLVIGTVQAIYALAAFVGDRAGLNLGGVSHSQFYGAASLRGGFQEPNFLGAFEAVVGLMFLSFLTAKVKVKKGTFVFGLILVLMALILSFTRAAWLAFAVGLFMLLFIQKPVRNFFNPRAAFVVVVLAAGVLFAVIPFANNLTSGNISKRIEEGLTYSNGSGATRAKVQDLAVQDWRGSELFGNGTMSLDTTSFYNGASLELKETAKGWVYSSLLQALHDTGIIGLFLYLWIEVGILAVVVRGYRKARDSFYRAALAGFTISSIAIFIASQASSFMWLGFFWIFSGLAVSVALEASRRPEGKTETSGSKIA